MPYQSFLITKQWNIEKNNCDNTSFKTRCIFSYSGLLSRGGPIFSRTLPRGRRDLYCPLGVYEKILALLSRGGPNTRKYSLVEVIANDCIVMRVGVYMRVQSTPLLSPQYSYSVLSDWCGHATPSSGPMSYIS